MKGGYSSLLPLFPLIAISFAAVINGPPLIPAMFMFGDSVVAVGNNNKFYTIVKANFPPYGRDFKDHQPTGRFCNRKLAADFTAENIGFTSYPPAYLDKKAKRKHPLIGANFASCVFCKQLEYYKEYQVKLRNFAGEPNATAIISCGLYLVSSGSSDFLQNYYINPLLYKNNLSNLTLVVLDIYQPLLDIVTNSSDYGFAEARRACCGTGLVETSILCNPKSEGTCKNASQYVFWDGFHPSEATNKILADDLLVRGISLIT
ncbi:hypothetical protein MLD38_011688 [Melastoma candidum]|uniref:Uncharacterized protein n=1 Tax=Melastoma candidum TaxID=119954 RepID=A0ACB9R3Z6_9MYRT|nr:hypothetical protein MLD38_011688 [Melastoma candidum]